MKLKLNNPITKALKTGIQSNYTQTAEALEALA